MHHCRLTQAPVIGSGSKQCRMLDEQSQLAEEHDAEACEGIASRRRSGKLRSRLPTLRGHGGKGEQRSKASQHRCALQAAVYCEVVPPFATARPHDVMLLPLISIVRWFDFS